MSRYDLAHSRLTLAAQKPRKIKERALVFSREIRPRRMRRDKRPNPFIRPLLNLS